jgi:N-acetyl-gamma-glutamyl-phosphate reductase
MYTFAMKTGILGASGYLGTELLRLCAQHDEFEVVVAAADSMAGTPVTARAPSLAAVYPSLVYDETDPARFDGLDLVFCALPHGVSQGLMPALSESVGMVVDLAADFRLKDPGLYPTWYGEEHHAPELLDQFVYGLPELDRSDLAGARLIAAAGCYPTAAALALAPLVGAGVIEPSGIIVDAASGVSGAGTSPSERLMFSSADENFSAYSLLTHRHTPEIEQSIGGSVLFTPHLAPMVRGILATCYARPLPGTHPTSAGVLEVLHEAYRGEPFIVVSAEAPSTKATSGSNCALLTARVDERTGWVLVLCAIDNLIKGAAGQAVQCANAAVGLPETTGLPLAGLYP